MVICLSVISFLSLSCDLGVPDTVVTGGPLPSDHEYELHEVRFHWGKENQRGSEHTVNFKAFPMEVSVNCVNHDIVHNVNRLEKLLSKELNLKYTHKLVRFGFFI